MNDKLKKIIILSAMSALGAILMILDISYPIAPFLKIEISDLIILLVFSMYGFKEALIVALVKTLANLIYPGPVGPIAIGQITALLTSMSYCFGLFLFQKVYAKVQKKLLKSILVNFSTVIMVTMILTFCNYLFITPVYLGFVTCFDKGFDYSYLGNGSYPLLIMSIYIPFNLIKGSIISILYVALIERILILFTHYKK